MTRDELYQKFGPLLIEAVALVFLEEINELRLKVKLPVKTQEQFIQALDSKSLQLSEYDWMKRNTEE